MAGILSTQLACPISAKAGRPLAEQRPPRDGPSRGRVVPVVIHGPPQLLRHINVHHAHLLGDEKALQGGGNSETKDTHEELRNHDGSEKVNDHGDHGVHLRMHFVENQVPERHACKCDEDHTNGLHKIPNDRHHGIANDIPEDEKEGTLGRKAKRVTEERDLNVGFPADKLHQGLEAIHATLGHPQGNDRRRIFLRLRLLLEVFQAEPDELDSSNDQGAET
mmetsp:Transcript_23513/g.58538  ORF Transcript_23513/g.58538 Transcript_23513/m.58538 type:complete len:221 (+) Transcript_23513:125-787(+)